MTVHLLMTFLSNDLHSRGSRSQRPTAVAVEAASHSVSPRYLSTFEAVSFHSMCNVVSLTSSLLEFDINLTKQPAFQNSESHKAFDFQWLSIAAASCFHLSLLLTPLCPSICHISIVSGSSPANCLFCFSCRAPRLRFRPWHLLNWSWSMLISCPPGHVTPVWPLIVLSRLTVAGSLAAPLRPEW